MHILYNRLRPAPCGKALPPVGGDVRDLDVVLQPTAQVVEQPVVHRGGTRLELSQLSGGDG